MKSLSVSQRAARMPWNPPCCLFLHSFPGVLYMSSSALANSTEPADSNAGEVRKLATLLEASQALLKEPQLKAGLSEVLEILGRHHGAIRSTVVLLNEQTGGVELEASAGAIEPGKRVRYRPGEGVTGQVLQSGKPIVVPQVSREPAFLHRAAKRPELASQELTYISVPIALDGADRLTVERN